MFQGSNERGKIAKWLTVSVLAAACLVAAPQAASATPVVEVHIAPPAERVEVVPARQPHHVWTRGYWAWNGHAHVWVPGRYVVERPGYTWREHRWEEHGHGHWRFHQGGWERH
ncbi:MAG: hypothetical protein ABUL62_18070 [Myxococcales bacterium]